MSHCCSTPACGGCFRKSARRLRRLIDPAALRWISWSHFEVDECGALNEWLAIAPRAQSDLQPGGRSRQHPGFREPPAARALTKNDVIETGRHKYRYVPTPHLPHGWDAGVFFEETSGVLLCSDLFHQIGDVEPVTSSDVLGRWDAAVAAYQEHPVLMDYLPLDARHTATLERARRSTAACARGHAWFDVRRRRRGRAAFRGRHAAAAARSGPR